MKATEQFYSVTLFISMLGKVVLNLSLWMKS